MQPAKYRQKSFYNDPKYILWFILLVLFIGLRHEVGGDWKMYIKLTNIYSERSIIEVSYLSDPIFHFLVWFGSNIWGGIYLVNIVCASFFSWGVLTFCKYQTRPDLALLVAVPYLIIVVSMGYVRQGVGIGLGLVAIIHLLDKKNVKFIGYIILAACFHKTALLYFSFALFIKFRNRFLIVFAISIFTSLLAVFFAIEYVVSQINQNAFVGMESRGTYIRLTLIWIPACVFLLFRKNFNFDENENIFWTWVSLSSFAFIILLLISPQNTIVDRLALYWIPLQLVVLSRIPEFSFSYSFKTPFFLS